MSRAGTWLRAWLTAYAPRLVRRRPAVQAELEPWLPCWVLRGTMAALALTCAWPLIRGPLTAVLIFALALAVLLQPSGVTPAAVIIAVAVLSAVSPDPPAVPRTALLVLGLHALAQLGALLGRAAWTAHVELAALLAPLPRFLAVQAVVQPLALLGAWLAGRDLGLAAAPILAVLGLAVVTYWWLPRLGGSNP